MALPSDCNLRRKASSYSVATSSGYFLECWIEILTYRMCRKTRPGPGKRLIALKPGLVSPQEAEEWRSRDGRLRR